MANVKRGGWYGCIVVHVPCHVKSYVGASKVRRRDVHLSVDIGARPP